MGRDSDAGRTEQHYVNMPKRIGNYMSKVTKPLIKPSSMLHFKLFTEWPLIVGVSFSAKTRPIRLTAMGRGEHAIRTLHVETPSGAVATELVYQEQMLIAKIATYFGHPIAGKIKFHVNTGFPLVTPWIVPRLNEEKKILLSEMTEDIVEDALKQALTKLGSHILMRK